MKKILLLLIVSVLTITMQAQTPISSPSEKQGIKVYPTLTQSQGSINVLMPQGVVAQKVTLTTNSGDSFRGFGWINSPVLHLPKLSKGLYLLVFWNNDKKVEAKEIIVQ